MSGNGEEVKSLKHYARVCKRVESILARNGMRQAWPYALEIGVSPKTVTEQLRQGKIPGVLVDSRWLVPTGTIEAAIKEGVFTPGGRGKYARKKGKRVAELPPTAEPTL